MKSVTNHTLKLCLFLLAFHINTNNLIASSFLVGKANVKINAAALSNQAPKYATAEELLNLKDGNTTSEALAFSAAYDISGEGVIQIGRSVSDRNGNLYITGGFTGKLTVGETDYASTQGYDFYLVKVNTSDEIELIRIGNGAMLSEDYFSLDGGLALAYYDDEDVLYVGGGFVRSLSFLDENGEVAQTLSSTSEDLLNLDLFVSKYDADGNFEWAMGGESASVGAENSLANGRNVIADIDLDPEGYPYVIGSFTGENLFGFYVDSVGESDIFIASLDKDGSDPFWVSTYGTPGNDSGISISNDGLGYLNIISIIGEGIIEFDGGDSYWDNDTGSDDTMVLSLDVNGEWYFSSFIGAGEQVVGLDLESVDNGSFYVTGSFSGEASFAGSDIVLESEINSVDGYIVKYNIDGDALWARQFGSSDAEGIKLTSDADENVYVLGSFEESVVFGIETDDPVVLTTESGNDLFVAMYDSSGNFKWVKQMKGSGQESIDRISRDEIPFRTTPLDLFYSDEDGGTLFLFGDFSGTLNLDPFTLVAPENSSSGFIAKLRVGDQATSNEQPLAQEIPNQTQLLQNYPNPFNPTTTIGFNLNQASDVKLEIFNMLGQRVRTVVNSTLPAGFHEMSVNADDLASGLYHYTLVANDMVLTKSMVLLK